MSVRLATVAHRMHDWSPVVSALTGGNVDGGGHGADDGHEGYEEDSSVRHEHDDGRSIEEGV